MLSVCAHLPSLHVEFEDCESCHWLARRASICLAAQFRPRVHLASDAFGAARPRFGRARNLRSLSDNEWLGHINQIFVFKNIVLENIAFQNNLF